MSPLGRMGQGLEQEKRARAAFVLYLKNQLFCGIIYSRAVLDKGIFTVRDPGKDL